MSGLTLLNAINICLRGVGESPAISNDSSNPYVIAAKDIISDKNREVQSTGWYFNRQKGFVVKRDAVGQCFVPQGTLSLDTKRGNNVVIRGSRLFDHSEATYIFEGDIEVDLVYEVEFEELPYVAANYIASISAEEMQATYEADRNKMQRAAIKSDQALTALKAVHLRNANYNALDRMVVGGSLGQRDPDYAGG